MLEIKETIKDKCGHTKKSQLTTLRNPTTKTGII